jgi:hypothetical protein
MFFFFLFILFFLEIKNCFEIVFKDVRYIFSASQPVQRDVWFMELKGQMKSFFLETMKKEDRKEHRTQVIYFILFTSLFIVFYLSSFCFDSFIFLLLNFTYFVLSFIYFLFILFAN